MYGFHALSGVEWGAPHAVNSNQHSRIGTAILARFTDHIFAAAKIIESVAQIVFSGKMWGGGARPRSVHSPATCTPHHTPIKSIRGFVETYLEKYLRELQEIRSSGEATGETSYYPPLRELLKSVGDEIKPKVRCILILKNRGAGLPDGGLFTKDQFRKLKDAQPLPGQKPGRGAIEVKSTSDGEQVTKYWREYGQVLVTNYRDFVLLGRDAEGAPVKLASYRLAQDEKAFWRLAAHPHKTAQEQGERFVDFLKLAMLSPAKLTEPKDVAWILAYYAREAKARVETHAELPALANIRAALEQALGLKFEGEKGEHFFRSSLVQTLFYGVFSAFVLWGKGPLGRTSKVA